LMLRETGGQYCRRPTFNQAKFRAHTLWKSVVLLQSIVRLSSGNAMPVSYHRDAHFIAARQDDRNAPAIICGSATALGAWLTVPA
jgi:hypothetical protein